MRTKPENPLPKTLPGAVCAQMVRCGKSNCKCAHGRLHGPYFYHFKRVNGALVKRYIKGKDASTVRAACDARRREERRQREARGNNLRRFRGLIRQLRESEELLLQVSEVRHDQT